MELPRIQYGLLYTKKNRILGIEEFYNGDDKYACGEYTYRLDEFVDTPWLLDEYDKVLMAKWSSEEWYNSSFEEPVNPYHPLDLQVIKVVTITTLADSTILDELDIVNDELQKQGYSQIDVKKYVEGDEPFE